jgi:hypothetical protein
MPAQLLFVHASAAAEAEGARAGDGPAREGIAGERRGAGGAGGAGGCGRCGRRKTGRGVGVAVCAWLSG